MQHHEQGGKAVPLGRELLCPMLSWVKAKTHYDILIPDGAQNKLSAQPAKKSSLGLGQVLPAAKLQHAQQLSLCTFAL